MRLGFIGEEMGGSVLGLRGWDGGVCRRLWLLVGGEQERKWFFEFENKGYFLMIHGYENGVMVMD